MIIKMPNNPLPTIFLGSKDFNSKVKIKFNTKIKKVSKPEIERVNKKLSGVDSIIAISSAKGGVGISTFTVNAAAILAKMGCKVGILDADIYGPSIPTMLDVEGYVPKSIKIDGVSKIEPVESYGIKLMSIGFFTKLDQAVVWRGPMASKALKQMIFDTNWGELDFLISKAVAEKNNGALKGLQTPNSSAQHADQIEGQLEGKLCLSS